MADNVIGSYCSFRIIVGGLCHQSISFRRFLSIHKLAFRSNDLADPNMGHGAIYDHTRSRSLDPLHTLLPGIDRGLHVMAKMEKQFSVGSIPPDNNAFVGYEQYLHLDV